jgi:hypothetical protein
MCPYSSVRTLTHFLPRETRVFVCMHARVHKYTTELCSENGGAEKRVQWNEWLLFQSQGWFELWLIPMAIFQPRLGFDLVLHRYMNEGRQLMEKGPLSKIAYLGPILN